MLRRINAPDLQRITFSDSAQLDAFGRLRTSEPATLFDSQSQYGASPLFWSSTTTAGATISNVTQQSSLRLSTATFSSSSAVHETITYWRYQPSKSLLVLTTGILGPSATSITKRMGYFDEENGVFLESDSTGNNIVLRSTVTASTNEERARIGYTVNGDPVNGNGQSHLSFDPTKSTIFWADFEWLGMGRVRTGLVDDGVFIPVHTFYNTQTKTTPYMTTANLPVRAEISASTTGVGSANSLLFTCCAVVSEGGFESSRGPILSQADSDGTALGSTVLKPILTIRPRATYSGVTNHGQVVPLSTTIMAISSPCYFELLYDGSLSSSSYIPVNANSIVEYDVSSNTITGGVRVASGFVAAAGTGVNARPGLGASIAGSLLLGHDKITGAGKPLTIAAIGIGGNSTVYPSITWQELY